MNSNVKGFTNKTVINQEAAQWILLLEDSPNLSQKQIDELNAWVSTSDVHKECLISMAQSWGEMDLLSEVMHPQEMHRPSFFSELLTNLFLPFVAVYSFLFVCIQHSKKILNPYVAAPILLSGVVAFTIITLQPADDTEGVVYATSIGEHQSHEMPDGSIIWLNSNTKINVIYNEAFRRIKLIEGEAHFEVAKDASRPFEVYADERLVRAIGTAFSVHKLDKNIEVIVSEGTVELAVVENTLVVMPEELQKINIDGKSNDAVSATNNPNLPEQATVKQVLGKLSAGQRIRIPIESEHISEVVELNSSEITRSLSWKEGKLVFAGEPLEEVIEEITRHTEVKIDVLDPQLKSMRIGGQFQLGETDTLFYVLESGFGISVDKLNDQHVQLRVKK